VRMQAGTRVPADVQATETQLAVDRRSLLQAKLQALNLEDQLRAALALDIQDIGIKPVDAPILRTADYDVNQQRQLVYANSPVLTTLLANQENNKYDQITARNANKPQVNVAASFTALGTGNQGTDGFNRFDNSSTQGNSAALNVSTPLLDKVGPANVQRRVNEGQSLDLQVRDQRNTLNIQLQTDLRGIRAAQEQIGAAHSAVILAQTQLANEVKRLSLGASTPFTVAQLQQQLSAAEQQEIAAQIQFELTDLARMVLTGEVYGTYGLQSYAAD